jgi:hypothetical protein
MDIININMKEAKDVSISMSNDRKKTIKSDMIKFLKDQVLTVTDLTRTSKLTDILDSYADKVSPEVFVVQNTKKKNSKAVISDLEYFQELLIYKELVDEAIDDVMYQMALERKGDVTNISLAKIIADHDLDIDEVLALSDVIEEEE